MLFTRVISYFTVVLTFGTLTLSGPAPAAAELSKRDNTDIEGVLTTLKASTDTILPQIQSVTASGNASDATVTPLINQLNDALNTASGSLSGLSTFSRALKKHQSDDDIANLVAGIITDITTTLDGLLDSAASIPTLGTLLGGIDSSLNQVLLGLEILLAGVLRLVANLLMDVAGLLNRLAFGLTLGTLGL